MLNPDGCRNISIALTDPDFGEKAQACVTAFHEKAGRSQVDSFWFLLVTMLLPSRVATVAMLPSALSEERFVR